MGSNIGQQRETTDDGPVIQRWKWAVIAALAVPSLIFVADFVKGAGGTVASALGMAILVFALTKAARRTGVSDWFEPRTWKSITVVSVVSGFVVAAELQGEAFHGFDAVLFFLLLVGGVFLNLLLFGVILKSGPSTPVRPK